MKVLKYDRVKGTSPVQSSNRISYITGNSGADISAICNEAVMTAVRRLVSQGKVPDDEEIAACKVTQDDFLKAVDKFGPKAAERLKAYGDLGKVPTE